MNDYEVVCGECDEALVGTIAQDGMVYYLHADDSDCKVARRERAGGE